MKNFRANLSFALNRRKLSYRAFAEDCKLTFIYVYRICNPNEHGKPEPSLDVCDRIAHALNYELADMLVTPREFRSKEATVTAA